jgi:hypothetical protein
MVVSTGMELEEEQQKPNRKTVKPVKKRLWLLRKNDLLNRMQE